MYKYKDKNRKKRPQTISKHYNYFKSKQTKLFICIS